MGTLQSTHLQEVTSAFMMQWVLTFVQFGILHVMWNYSVLVQKENYNFYKGSAYSIVLIKIYIFTDTKKFLLYDCMTLSTVLLEYYGILHEHL
jgi:hypothetical protein